jgi:murein L,D-transpeptidase YafK
MEIFNMREEAISWWNMLSPDERSVYLNKYQEHILMGNERNHSTLTGREVEIIYSKEYGYK